MFFLCWFHYSKHKKRLSEVHSLWFPHKESKVMYFHWTTLYLCKILHLLLLSSYFPYLFLIIIYFSLIIREAVVSLFLPHTDITTEYEATLPKGKVSTNKQETAPSTTESFKLNISKNMKGSSLNFKVSKVCFFNSNFNFKIDVSKIVLCNYCAIPYLCCYEVYNKI